MKKIIYLVILILFFNGLISSNVYSSTVKKTSEEWAVTFGGTNIDVGYFVQQTTDGGYIITGYTRSYGASGHNVWLIKTDNLGNKLWDKTFGGSADDEGQSVQQTSDGGYIIAGWTKSYGAGGEDLWLIKTDSSGNEQWNRYFGGSSNDRGASVRQTTDGGYLVAGSTFSFGAGSADAWLIKTDSSGNQQWTKTLGGLSSDGAYYLQLTTDGGYILTGWTMSYGPGSLLNAWLLKTDNLGNEQWNKAFGGTGSDKAYCVQQTTDDGYILTGETDSFGAGLIDAWLIKTDSSGNEQWSKTFGGSGRDYGYSVQQTLLDNYIIVGYTLSYGAGNEDVWLIKTDSSGNKIWDETYGGASSDEGFSIQQTTDGGYIITGHTLSYGAGLHDVWLIKIESDETPLPLEVDAGGPYEGTVGDPISFAATVVGGVSPYDYLWDFGDGNTSTNQGPTHIYMIAGNYTVNLTVTDNNGNESSDNTWANIQGLNNPPETPDINGPNSGKVKVEIEYTFSTLDPESDDVFYLINWGDGTSTDWIGPTPSGEEIKIKHKWNKIQTYTISCKAKDTNEAQTSWATMEVNIPRYKFVGNTLIQRFIQHYSKIFFLIKTLF